MANRMILNEISYFGSGSRREILTEINDKRFQKVFVVTDKTLMEVGVTKLVLDILDEGKIAYEIYDEVKPNPTVLNVQNGVDHCKTSMADVIVAVGGGSVIDTAKAIGIVMSNPEFEDVVSLDGVAPTKNKSLPIIALPTTAGTAAEVTINYVITDEKNVKKMVCVDPHDIPIVAIIDTDLMEKMPKMIAASTGMDALTHAIEGLITKAAWEMTDMFHLEAIKLIYANLKKAVLEKDKNALEKVGLAQYIAGMGFSNVGLGIVHSMAHPLGAVYDTPHGIANALLLPYVLEYNGEVAYEKYVKIGEAFGISMDGFSKEEIIQKIVHSVRNLAIELNIPQQLRELNVNEDDLHMLAEKAYNDVCTGGNPRETSIEEIYELYKKAY